MEDFTNINFLFNGKSYLQIFCFIACPVGYFGSKCGVPCQYPTFGQFCTDKCNCSQSECNHIQGCKRDGKNLF